MVVLKLTDSVCDSAMCQPTVEYASKADSDDEFKWEEFFGTSVDITSTLLDMFDTIAAKNNAVSIDVSTLANCNGRQPTPPPPSSLNFVVSPVPPPPCDPGGGGVCPKGGQLATKHSAGSSSSGRRPTRLYSSSSNKRRSYSESVFEEKKRPLSTSSVSSSSSSSSSLPRNGLDVKKSYLASIESLDDDDHYAVEESSVASSSADHRVGQGTAPGVSLSSGPQTTKPRWCDPNLSHTDRVVLEIVDTERTYVRDLDEIIQGYLKHIKEAKHPKVTCQYLEELFSNIEDIHSFNSSFVEELEQCSIDPVAMARCFVNNSSGFEVYTQYCTNYPRTVSVLTELMGNSETAEIFKDRQLALQHSLPLGSYLLKPVQRILKYHLLLQNLVKYSDKDSGTCIDIKNALSVMTGIAYHINDMKRKHEHAVRVQEIQSLLYGWEGEDLTTYGELVAEGAFRMFRAKALRHLFLFDKMILIAKKKEEGILSYKTHIMCSNLMLIESIQGEPLCFHVIPFDNPRYQYTFQARNLEQKREWCLQLKRVILENYNAVIPSHARQLVMELGQSKMEDSALEKTTSKRQLSAPEYLEKRKQERRKSEINLKRGFKLRTGSKKGDLVPNGKCVSSSGRRKSASVSNSPQDDVSYSRESWSSQMDINGDHNDWTKSQDNVNPNGEQKSGYSSGKSRHFFSRGGSYNLLFNRDTRLRHSLPEPSLSQRSASKVKSFRPSWRAWNSVPEETTDTENEEINECVGIQRNFRYQDKSFESESVEEPYDSSGEYVTFFYAHAYATRDDPKNSYSNSVSRDSIGSELENQNRTDGEINFDVCSGLPSSSPQKKNSSKAKTTDSVCKTPHLGSAQCLKGETVQKDQDSESCSSGYSWKQSAALRRVQSFTGMARAKMSSLHHNMSFKHHSKTPGGQKSKRDRYVPVNGEVILPSGIEDSSPTAPAAWLKLQEQHLANAAKKSGSLPRSFQLSSELTESTSETNLSLCSENGRTRLRNNDGQRSQYSEQQRPFTIASDMPNKADDDDMRRCFVLECSPDGEDDYCLLVRSDHYEPETTTGCTNTPAVSMENINSIHPELKIYHQAASKYSSLKQVFTNMGSKIASLRAVLSSSVNRDQTDSSCVGDTLRNSTGWRSSSRSSIRSENDVSTKVLTVRLAHSVAKAYSAVMKHRTKKCDIKSEEKASLESKMKKSKSVPTYKSESSLIGARMAHPLEAEYSVPKHIISPDQLKKWKNDLRPDSLLSEYSNITSSSDGDKVAVEEMANASKPEAEDTASEASESSADSYYERTFDAIENVLAEDIFRDSAIYSDPEDADFSAEELPKLPLPPPVLPKKKQEGGAQPYQVGRNGYTVPSKLDLLCKRPVNQAILERLKILEENVRCQKEDSSFAVKARNNVIQKRLDTEKLPLHGESLECEESETSSEHSASTVNTVMEFGHMFSENCAGAQAAPRIKGWVKHVVDKLQGEL